jgi:hypothetical protein
MGTCPTSREFDFMFHQPSHLVGSLFKSLENKSTVEHRPADPISQSLVVENEFTNRLGKLFALPPTLEPPGMLALSFGDRRTHGLDRVGRSTEFMCSDMCHHSRLTSSVGGVPGGSAQWSCR